MPTSLILGNTPVSLFMPGIREKVFTFGSNGTPYWFPATQEWLDFQNNTEQYFHFTIEKNKGAEWSTSAQEWFIGQWDYLNSERSWLIYHSNQLNGQIKIVFDNVGSSPDHFLLVQTPDPNTKYEIHAYRSNDYVFAVINGEFIPNCSKVINGSADLAGNSLTTTTEPVHIGMAPNDLAGNRLTDAKLVIKTINNNQNKDFWVKTQWDEQAGFLLNRSGNTNTTDQIKINNVFQQVLNNTQKYGFRPLDEVDTLNFFMNQNTAQDMWGYQRNGTSSITLNQFTYSGTLIKTPGESLSGDGSSGYLILYNPGNATQNYWKLTRDSAAILAIAKVTEPVTGGDPTYKAFWGALGSTSNNPGIRFYLSKDQNPGFTSAINSILSSGPDLILPGPTTIPEFTTVGHRRVSEDLAYSYLDQEYISTRESTALETRLIYVFARNFGSAGLHSTHKFKFLVSGSSLITKEIVDDIKVLLD